MSERKKIFLESSLNSIIYLAQVLLALSVNFLILASFPKENVGFFVVASQLVFIFCQVAKFGIWDTLFAEKNDIIAWFGCSGSYIFPFYCISTILCCLVIIILSIILDFFEFRYLLYFVVANTFFFVSILQKISGNYILGEFYEKAMLNIFFLLLVIIQINIDAFQFELVTLHIASYVMAVFFGVVFLALKKRIVYDSLKIVGSRKFWKMVSHGKRFFVLNIEANLTNQAPIYILSLFSALDKVADWNFIMSCIRATMAPAEACKALFRRNGVYLFKSSRDDFWSIGRFYSIIVGFLTVTTLIFVFLLYDIVIGFVNSEYLMHKEIVIAGAGLAGVLAILQMYSTIAFLTISQKVIYIASSIRFFAGCSALLYFQIVFNDLSKLVFAFLFVGILYALYSFRWLIDHDKIPS